PKIHEDTFALRLIGLESGAQLSALLAHGRLPAVARMSAFFALRHRFFEERLVAALDRGVGQVVLLGAGLDSFALRRPSIVAGVLFVEVDHPDTQRWKLDRLTALDLVTPT